MTAATASAGNTAEAADSGAGSSARLKFAARTALSLTLAYLIPMVWGWPQPQTAAITVMLIAATGSLSESLQKGVLRTLGTVAGAAVGLSLIALLPQDRLLYLAAMSVFVTLVLYLYNAYQGDSTVFMLTIVVALMVFNGGDADGAFIYGIDRTLLTAFGVLIYSLVGSLLWPVKTADNLQRLGAAVSADCARAGTLLIRPDSAEDRRSSENAALEALLASLEQFRSHYVSVKSDAGTVQARQAEWNAILAGFERLESILVPALRSGGRAEPDFDQTIANHGAVLGRLDQQLRALQACWVEDAAPGAPAPLAAVFDSERLKLETQLTVAAVVSRARLLEDVQAVLRQLIGAVCSLRFDSGVFDRGQQAQSTPAFIWLDRENLKTALRGFITFWMATLIWIVYQPPGGFMFVTLCTALVPLVSYTPVTPKLLIFLFSFGFAFALPAYVFLLPAMTHWLELALFLFGYAFLGFYLFAGPVAIFFLLGLFTLGIQNTMAYHVDVLLLVMLMFYLVCALLIISVHFPFSSRPSWLYLDFRRRFMHLCAGIIRSGPPETAGGRVLNNLRMVAASALLGKMRQWGGMIDSRYFPGNSPQDIAAFNHRCENLLARLRALTRPNNPYAANRLVAGARRSLPTAAAADLCDALAEMDDAAGIDRAFDRVRGGLQQVEPKLRAFLESAAGDNAVPRPEREIADFYVYINLQASILVGIDQCREALAALDMRQLRETKF